MGRKATSRNCPDPPDGGWGWIVAIGSHMALQNAVIVRSIGVFFNEWKDYFGASATAVGAIGSVHMAAFFFMGKVAIVPITLYPQSA